MKYWKSVIAMVFVYYTLTCGLESFFQVSSRIRKIVFGCIWIHISVHVIYLWYLRPIKAQCRYSSNAYNCVLYLLHDWTTQWNFRFKVNLKNYYAKNTLIFHIVYFLQIHHSSHFSVDQHDFLHSSGHYSMYLGPNTCRTLFRHRAFGIGRCSAISEVPGVPTSFGQIPFFKKTSN